MQLANISLLATPGILKVTSSKHVKPVPTKVLNLNIQQTIILNFYEF